MWLSILQSWLKKLIIIGWKENLNSGLNHIPKYTTMQGKKSSEKAILHEVQQSSVLGSHLFIIFIKDLHTAPSKHSSWWRRLGFLHRWDYCRTCKFDTDVKIENYYNHDGEQLLNFYKRRTYQNTEQIEGCFLVIFLLQETKISNFDKNCTQENVKCHIQHEHSHKKQKESFCFLWLCLDESWLDK